MPATSGTVDECGKKLASLEAEADSLLDRFVATLESGKGFHSSMEKIEGQLEAVKARTAAQSEMELNEAAVLADKLLDEIALVQKMAPGAALSGVQDTWAGDFEQVRASLERMGTRLRRMKSSASQPGAGVVEARGLHLTFNKDAKACRARLDALAKSFANRKGGAHSQVLSAKKRAELLRASVGKSFERLARAKMTGKIAAAKGEIIEFMRKTGEGRIFVDHKHLTITSNGNRMRVPLTQAFRFGLEDIAPLQKELAKLGSSVVVGSYGMHEGRQVLRIGQRAVVGDSVVFREKSFYLN